MKRVDVVDFLDSGDGTTIAVASTGTVYTKAVKLSYGEFFALSYKATSDGTVNLKIELEQSWDLPGTEGASDTDWVVPENMSAIESALADETQHHKALSPVTLPYGRLKITGGSGNDASTTLRARLGQQQEF